MLLCGFTASALLMPGAAPSPPAGTLNVGFTFSQQQTEYMDLSYQDAYRQLMQLSPSVVRLAAYWNKIEPEPGFYDFSALDWLVANTPPATRVVLVVGMKAPRWPEYYIPAWLQQANDMPERARVSDDLQLHAAVLDFVRAVVEHYEYSPAIAYWQVENEPLDPAGPRQWTIGPDVLAEEIGLVRKLDDQHRQVEVSTFVSTDPPRQLPGFNRDLTNRVRDIVSMADVLGLDVYAVRAHRLFGEALFFRWPAFIWQRQLRAIQQTAGAAGKQVWVTELQAEPWLLTRLVYLDRLPSPEIAPSETTFVARELEADGFQTALLWGAEYWYMRRQRYSDNRWWLTAQQILA